MYFLLFYLCRLVLYVPIDVSTTCNIIVYTTMSEVDIRHGHISNIVGHHMIPNTFNTTNTDVNVAPRTGNTENTILYMYPSLILAIPPYHCFLSEA